ncbi:MAG: hypothetical protein HOM14_01530 [Gammaproteobacteria bacterium]|jgi:hypothetical protein|nr:hypothetical protein [Gammaproteobacteria bacterium]MBT3724277.1 hypothetical protein [Gammaproteobacteria bacterium]MBT4076536.1 hypothetical protein [Gammaproteobacteria bacterium]MBT4193474.1 hypothetical protein [Gammaproteobacteria bacterium]MBT4449223.1 hypothetical protein [Gammaproteobacteria bacterium]
MNDFYLERHFKLWEDKNTLLKRIVFLTVVISLSLVIKVLTPFVDFSVDKKPVIEVIASLNKNKESVNRKILLISNTAQVLQDVNKFISKQPWQKQKYKLIDRYKEMRISPPAEGYTHQQYQQEADTTINNIAELLQENILYPLEQSMVNAEKNGINRLNKEMDSLKQFIQEWKESSINVNWFQTLRGKDRKMYQLTVDLNQRLDEFSRVINLELTSVKKKKATVDKELKVLTQKIESEAEKLQSLDSELQRILPEWLRGLVKIEQVIQLLPVILLGTASFVLILGMSLTRHYNIYRNGKEFSRELTDDPGMSTVWTLIYRGITGSILTIIAYSLFIIFSWFLFERSIQLLQEWLIIDPSQAWVSSVELWDMFLWLGRAGFMLLLIIISSRLRRIMAA